MWATSASNYHSGPCSCTTTGCTCGSTTGPGWYRIEASGSTSEVRAQLEEDDPPQKNDPVPPWLAGAAFGGKMRKRQRGPEFSSPRALRQHRSQSR